MSDPFRVLIIGCGNIAGGFDADRPQQAAPLTHAGAFSRHGGFELSACVDPDDARRNSFMQRWSVRHGYGDTKQLTREPRFDVISICSPTPLHSEHLTAALRLGPRLIFCEKPVTDSATGTAGWVRQCAQAGVLLAVNHLRRWAADVSCLRSELQAGLWGQMRSAVGHYNKGILNNGSHLIDLLHQLLGPMELQSTGAAIADFRDEDPTVTAALVARGGIPVYLNAADARDYSFFELELLTSTAVLRMEEGGTRWRIRAIHDSPTFKGYRAPDRGEFRDGGLVDAMTRAVTNIHAALLTGAPLACTGEDALLAQQVCEQIRAKASGAAQMLASAPHQ